MNPDPKEELEDEIDDTDAGDEGAADDADDADAGDEGAADDADDADAGDKGASDDADDADAGDEGGKAASGGRGATRVKKVVQERNSLREENARLRGLAEGLNSRGTQPANSDAARREREEKLALMSPEEKREFLRDEEITNMKTTALLTQLRTEDALDRFTYESKAESNPVYAKHKDEVERRLNAERNAGRNWPRATILAQIIGETALKTRPKPKAKENAQRRVEAATTRPVSMRSNARSPGGKRREESFEELERRLENQVF